MPSSSNLPFNEGDWLVDRNNPAQPGQFTGRTTTAGPLLMVELRYPDGRTSFRPESSLDRLPQHSDGLLDRMLNGQFGSARDLRRVITYEKLKGTLHEVIYSMEAAQIDFYPYQFKPVMKLISAPTERLIIADEVGLGKTIESALIWLELQARRQAKRLLVVCPTSLADKWREELRQKFLIDARTVDFRDLEAEINEFQQVGPSYPFALIGTYAGLRPPRSELNLLRRGPGDGPKGTPKTEFLRKLKHTLWDHEPFDLVIFDEAHYMRTPSTSTFALGDALSDSAAAVLCVSATPVNNSNTDLHSLLRLVDRDFFENQSLFEELLKANRPTVQAGIALAGVPIDTNLLSESLKQMGKSAFISESPLFARFSEAIKNLDPNDKAEVARSQDMAEKLNILGQYVNRTRRVQVTQHRPVRDPVVLEVHYNGMERKLYNTILHFVRERCKQDNRAFHVFQILQLQLRAASCLPVVVQELRENAVLGTEALLQEAFGEAAYDSLFEDEIANDFQQLQLRDLLAHDFEKNDTKYAALRQTLTEHINDEKVIIFAYYRGTLSYLQRRLSADGVTVTTIHGGICVEDRDTALRQFADASGPRVLLSSEVGSEGIDLQFCRVVVNYDLPWNPMRVEQRIGRIDRVGQKADRLSIVNFKVAGTVEERLYERLHAKLMKFTNSLGDLESIIGREVQSLTVDLLSNELTPEQEAARMDLTEAAIQNELLQIEELERASDALLALSDYLQRRIDEVRDRGRYMLPEELEDYVVDFFNREFQGCEVNENTPIAGAFRVRLSVDAHGSLQQFMQNDASLSARPFRQREFSVTFQRSVAQSLDAQDRVHFTNHLSPLIRWITKENRDRAHALFNVSALSLDSNDLPTGVYCYRIDRWYMKALTSQEKLIYSVIRLGDKQPLSADMSEQLIQRLLRVGIHWDEVDCEPAHLRQAYNLLEEFLASLFDVAVTDFVAENDTAAQIREQRVRAFFDRRIEQDKRRIETLQSQNPESRALRASEGRLQNAIERKAEKLRGIQTHSEPDVETSPVAAGVILLR